MITYERIEIQSIEDYNKILNIVPQTFRDNPYISKWIEELKERIGTKCTGLLVEYPYYDSKYLSSYYRYYIKKFKNYGKKSSDLLKG